MSNLTSFTNCPCGSQHLYTECCQRYHAGEKAPTPEALMRSRFTAFVLKLEDYLFASWHVTSRPTELDLANAPNWTSLRILGSQQKEKYGQVHFQAIYRLNSGWGYLQENSEFIQEGNDWYYLKGNPQEGILKPGRNEPCPCGSGKKFKTCCA